MFEHPLKFLGTHSAFSNHQNSAYFVTPENEMILIDCPPSTYYQFVDKSYSQLKEDFKNAKQVYVLITHTHSDHVAGLAMLIEYAYWAYQKKIYVIAPSKEVGNDIQTLLQILACTCKMYTLLIASNISYKWFVKSIPTIHVKELEGKCFGYSLIVDGNKCIYTGDTSIIEPFLPYLDEGTFFYVESAIIQSGVHLNIQDFLDIFVELAKNGVKILLMHTDNEQGIRRYIIENGYNANIRFV